MMNGSMLIIIALLALTVFMFYRVMKLSGRNKINTKMLKILEKIEDRDAFFEAADSFIATEKDVEYVQKVSVLRLWGDAYHDLPDQFREHLDTVNVDTLLNPDGKNKGFSANEDSFFYLYMAMPNRLHYMKHEDLRALLDEKMAAYSEVNGSTLLKKLHDENDKYYTGRDDRGKGFMRQLLDGEYSGYTYSKQLIGLYKHCEEAILAKMYLEEGDLDAYEEAIADLDNFGRNTRLGIRWLKEVGLELPAKETDAKESSAEDPKSDAKTDVPAAEENADEPSPKEESEEKEAAE